MDKYDFSHYVSKMLVDSFSTEEDFTFIERLALEELQKGKATGEEYRPLIVDILLDIYEKKKDEKKFLSFAKKSLNIHILDILNTLNQNDKLMRLSNVVQGH